MDNKSVDQNATDWLSAAWDKRDKRVDDWPMMSSPLPTLYLIAIYVVFALKVGPKLMKKREAFYLRKQIVAFNIVMVLYNGYLFYQIWVLAWGNDYSWVCQPLDRSMSPRSLKIARTVWLFYICKYVDWFDTLFFILRKKFEHVSTLHVYHHSVMPCFSWIAMRYMPGGHATFGGLLNTGVHIVMHFYYCVSAMGPQYQKYLWWKKYITILQLAQFVIGIIHACLAIFIFECGIDLPFEWGYFFIGQTMLFIYLFVDFYKKSYTVKKPIDQNGVAVPVPQKVKGA